MNREKEIAKTKQDIEKAITRDNLIIQTTHSLNEITKSINKLSMNLKERYFLYAPYTAKEGIDKILEAISHPKKESMGISMTKEDLSSIKQLADTLKKLQDLQNKQEYYLESLTKEICPELQKAATTSLCASLLDYASSLKNLAKMPSSRIQILGAEKALFRHLKEGANPPKFGIIFSHSEISKAQNKGKAARQLAAKISLAAKKDYFKNEN